MKKRILSVLLALVMVCTLLPVTASAAENYDLWVGGVQVTSANASDILGDGTVSYNHGTKTLTLNGATITSAYECSTFWHDVSSIYATEDFGDLTIYLEGNNVIVGQLAQDGTSSYGINIWGDLTLAGSGNLTVSSATTDKVNSWSVAIYSEGNITVKNCTITAYAGGSPRTAAAIYLNYDKDFVLSGTVVSVASRNSDGSNPESFNSGWPEQYKYLKIVPGVSVTGVTLDQTTLSLTAGNSEPLTATVAPDNATNKNVMWISSDENVATVTNGVVTAVAAGTATIIVKTVDGEKTATCAVTVAAPAPATLTGTVTITGETKFGSVLTATVTGSNNTGTLSYQWYRGGVELTGATSDTYTLVQNDLNEKMKVVVTSSVQTGNIESAQTAVVEKADCLDVPTGLAGVAPSTAGGNNGKITGTTSAMEYSEYSDFHSSTTCDENETRAWHPGTYYVRYRATDTHKAGTNYATVIVPDLTPVPSTTYRDYFIYYATLSEVQQELNGVADVTSNDGVITIKLTSNINGRLDFDRNSGKFVLDMNDKTIDAGTTYEALCLNNGFTGTVKVIGSGTFKTGIHNIVYGGGKLTIGLSEGKDYFTLVKDGTPVFVDVNTGTTVLSTFERGNELVLTQCNGIIRTITFHANGGTGTMAAASAIDGTNYTLPSCTFTAPSGKEFKGWATTANGTVLSGTTLAVTANVDLYAIWEETTQGGGNGGGNQGGNNPTPPAPTYPSYNSPVITTPSVDVDDSTLNDAAGALGNAVLDSKAEIVPAAGYTVEKIAKLQSEGKLNLVIDKKASYDAADKALVDTAAAKKAALCTQYLDIDAVLKTDSGEVVATVKNTVKPLTITIALSAEMQQAAKDGKTLLVVRCHEGKCDYLNGTLNAEKTEITIQSAQFSTYAVIAVESDAAKTFDGGIALYGAMALLSVGGGAALVIGKKRKD